MTKSLVSPVPPSDYLGCENVPQPVIFRVDASTKFGLGHISRCLALAQHLSSEGIDTIFICRRDICLPFVFAENSSLLLQLETDKLQFPETVDNYQVLCDEHQIIDSTLSALLLKNNNITAPAIVVVDHNQLSRAWEVNFLNQFPSNKFIKVVVFDDYANRSHACDLLIDHVMGHTFADYAGLIPDTSKFIGAPSSIILRPQFYSENIDALEVDSKSTSPKGMRIFLTMGGLDPSFRLLKILKALSVICQIHQNISVDLMISESAPHLSRIKSFAISSGLDMLVHTNVENPSVIMRNAAFGVTAAGLTSYELASCNIPMLLIPQSPAEVVSSHCLELNHYGRVIANFDALSVELLVQIIDHFIVTDMSCTSASSQLIDGKGALRISEAIFAMISRDL